MQRNPCGVAENLLRRQPRNCKLGLYSLNTIITVERDQKYIFFKNLNKQILPFFGVVFTIFQSFSDNFIRLILILLFTPFALFINFSEERNRIDKYDK